MSETTLARTFRLLFRAADGGDARRRRLVGILQGVVTSLGNRVIGMAVTFLSVPLTIGYLGTERYGAWTALGSVLAWFQLTDFGLGHGLTNAVSAAAGRDRPDLVRMHVSNGVFVLSIIAAATGALAAIVWPFLDWSAIFGVKSPEAQAEIGRAVAAALAICLLNFPLSVIGKVYNAFQEGRLANYWGAAGNLLSLAALVAVTQTSGGLVWLVIAVSGASLLVNVASGAWLFLAHRPILRPGLPHLDLSEVRALTGIGGRFFLIQIMALVTFQTDNLVIGHFLGADRIPEYSLTYSLFSYTGLPQSIAFTYLWSAYAEAIARRDIAWVARVFRINLAAGMAFTAVAVAGLWLIAKPFIERWAGPAVVPSSALVFWMAAWSLINAFTNPIACLLAAAAHLRAQIAYSAMATVCNLILSILLVQRWGVDGVIAATVLSYAAFVCIPIYVDVELLLRRLARAV